MYKPDFAAAGGLMGLAAPVTEQWRLVGTYTAGALRRREPRCGNDSHSTVDQIGINLKTAKALGLTIPETLLATADEVIQ
jgi:putative ABC transport system substrate-binding protein